MDSKEVATLLEVYERANNYGEQLTNIRDEALKRLKAMNDSLAEKPDTPHPAPTKKG
jgi:hypothetical protein